MNKNSTLKPAGLPVRLPTGGWKLPNLNNPLPAEPSPKSTPRFRPPLERSVAGFIPRTKAEAQHSFFGHEAATHTEGEFELLPKDTPRARPSPEQDVPRSLFGSESQTESEGLHLSGEPVLQAVPEAGPAAHTASSSLPGTFEILSEKLHGTQREQFEQYNELALKWEEEKEKNGQGAYARKAQKYTKADGTEGTDRVLVRSEEKLGVQLHAWQAAKGKEVQTGLNKVGRVLREKTGRPCKTGTEYGSDKGKGLLNQNNQVPNDFALAAVSGSRLLNTGLTAYANFADPTLGADLTSVTDGLAALAVVPSGIDAVFATEAHLRQLSEREKAKSNLRFRQAADRFMADPGNAAPEDAEGFLNFMDACEKLFGTTLEDSSTRKAARDRAIRSPMTAMSNTVGAVIEGVNSTVSVSPLAGAALAPLAIVGGVIEVDEGKHELLRRVDQQARASLRKELMQELLSRTDPASTEYQTHHDNELAQGLIQCFSKQQDRLLRQAKREKKFARGRIFRGGGTVGGAAATAAALAAAAGLGVLTAATAGVAAVPLLVLGTGWGFAVGARNYKRVRADHNAKWRQRMVQAIALDTPREALASKLAGNEDIEFAQEEGEYEPEKGHFAGHRKLELKARDNEYLGLHLLALKVQDLARGKEAYDKNSPVMKLLHGVGIDQHRLLAICKAVAAKEPNEQLDYIQSRLAPKLGMKFIVAPGTRTQEPAHPSIFLKHFGVAANSAFWENKHGLVPHSSELFPEIRKQLAARYSDPAGMLAFHQAVKTFLKKTEHLPQTKDTEMLKAFDEYLQAREKFEGLVRKTDAEIEQKKQRQRERAAVEEATDLVKELEQFHRMQQADQIVLPRA